jgi:large subunit ribosomal protein L23
MILSRPIITEKSMRDAAQGRFTFAVAKEASTAQIASEVGKTFGVKVLLVRTSIVKKKTSPWKKAIVELPAGEKIDLFDISENAQKT